MTLRRVALPTLLVVWTTFCLAAPAPQPWKPVAKPPATPVPAAPTPPGRAAATEIVDSVPDTGQFLPDTAMLARIDDKVIRVRTFREFWFGSYAQSRPRPDSAGRCEFLDNMINKEVLAALARKVDKPFGFEDRAVMREFTQRTLSNIVFQRLVADSATIPEEEVRHAYEQRGVELHLQHILTSDRGAAEQARRDLLAGRLTWPAAVHRFSIARRDSGPDGDLGWRKWTAFDPAVALEIFDLKEGQLSSVFFDADGFHVARVAGRRAAPLPAYTLMRGVVLHDLQPLAISRRVEGLRERLRQQLGMVYDSTNIAWAASLFGQTAAVQRDAEGNTVLDISGVLPEFADADTARLLASWRGGRYSLGDFLAAYKAIPVPQRQNVNTFESLRYTLDTYTLEPHFARLAVERGLDRDPLAVAYIDRRREQIQVEHLFADSVQARVWITPEERRHYYESRLREFYSFQNVTFAAILRHDKPGADSLRQALLQGAAPAAVLRADSLAGEVTGSIRTMREDEHGQYYKTLFEEMKPGEVRLSGPDKVGDYLVLQKLAHDPGRQLRYDEVQSIVDESLQNIKAEEALKQLIARHRSEHDIVTHPGLMMRVKLVDPSLDD